MPVVRPELRYKDTPDGERWPTRVGDGPIDAYVPQRKRGQLAVLGTHSAGWRATVRRTPRRGQHVWLVLIRSSRCVREVHLPPQEVRGLGEDLRAVLCIWRMAGLVPRLEEGVEANGLCRVHRVRRQRVRH
jgi:hypothetical protein